MTVEEHLDALRTDPDEWVRFEVVDRLEARGRDDARTVPALIDALTQDESAAVRGTTASILAEHIQDKRVANALTQALADQDADVRASAAWALAQRSD